MLRSMMYLGVLAGTVAVPYAFYNHENWVESGKGFASSMFDGDKTEQASETDIDALLDMSNIAGASSIVPNAAAAAKSSNDVPTVAMSDALRFDVSPQTVIARWPRVSTMLDQLDLEGMRVPLVTGTGVNDLAGSLTYYFDRQGQVQRITFSGYTGDASQLVNLVTQYYHFKPEPTLAAGLYLVKWNGKPVSALRIRHSAVVRVDAPRSQLEVQLEINHPGMRYGLSPAMAATLDRDLNASRWGRPKKVSMTDRMKDMLPTPQEKPVAKEPSP